LGNAASNSLTVSASLKVSASFKPGHILVPLHGISTGFAALVNQSVTTTPRRWWSFANVAWARAASVLRAAPTPHAAARLTPRRVVTLLKQAGRRNDAGLAEKISSTLRAEALRQPGPVEHALGVAAIGLIETITAMSDAIAALKAELATLFDQHAQASIITSFPDSGRSQR
jgi:hypothetical protein